VTEIVVLVESASDRAPGARDLARLRAAIGTILGRHRIQAGQWSEVSGEAGLTSFVVQVHESRATDALLAELRSQPGVKAAYAKPGAELP
jgi:hypothetical protein